MQRFRNGALDVTEKGIHFINYLGIGTENFKPTALQCFYLGTFGKLVPQENYM